MKKALLLSALALLVLAGSSSALVYIYDGVVKDNHTGSWTVTEGADVLSNAPYSDHATSNQNGYYAMPGYPTPAGTYKVVGEKVINGDTYGTCGWHYYNGSSTTHDVDLYMTHPPVLCEESK
jgi:hypothetical protein